ncbi:hypothetical protein TUBRATIS_23320 [Tubulinosema ratisbonensis]|uniref:Uncharacterized protein n=1 Tax=Tubulinosema ratisbonensis TaxID=291195 RepID=A0A437AJE3_9MICR|nr:hypothetical protein TUBRATIS_23320 [Tubulinosema ratisbonensis]
MKEELTKFYNLITAKKIYKNLIFEGVTFDQIVYQIDDITSRVIEEYENKSVNENISSSEEIFEEETKLEKKKEKDYFEECDVDLEKITAKEFFEILDKEVEGSEESSQIESDYLEERELNSE